jgi:hypothetical protein
MIQRALAPTRLLQSLAPLGGGLLVSCAAIGLGPTWQPTRQAVPVTFQLENHSAKTLYVFLGTWPRLQRSQPSEAVPMETTMHWGCRHQYDESCREAGRDFVCSMRPPPTLVLPAGTTHRVEWDGLIKLPAPACPEGSSTYVLDGPAKGKYAVKVCASMKTHGEPPSVDGPEELTNITVTGQTTCAAVHFSLPPSGPVVVVLNDPKTGHDDLSAAP